MLGVTSCPFKKVSMMLFRGEISKRISFAFAMTEDNAHLTLSERDVHDQNGTDYDAEMRRKYVVLFSLVGYSWLYRYTICRPNDPTRDKSHGRKILLLLQFAFPRNGFGRQR